MIKAKILKAFGVIFVAFIAIDSRAETPSNRNCLSRHLKEAIDLNLVRRPIYGQASEGRSLAISDELIDLEKTLRVQSLFADTWARFFQIQNIDVLCNELTSMDKTPALPLQLPVELRPSLESYKDIQVHTLQTRLNEKLSQDLNHVAQEAKIQIQTLQDEPRFNCITRHFLESIFVFARHGQAYVDRASTFQKKHLNYFFKKIIKSHIDLLEKTDRLDLRARDLQAEGLPILCQDVPSMELN